MMNLSACLLGIVSFASYSQDTGIVNSHRVSATAVMNGVDSDSIYIFDIFYSLNFGNNNDQCSLTITEISNLSCSGNRSAYLQKPSTVTHKEGLICNAVKQSNGIEKAVIFYNTPSETTALTIGSDARTGKAVEFEGSTLLTISGVKPLKTNYTPLKGATGNVNKSIKCGKLDFRALKTD